MREQPLPALEFRVTSLEHEVADLRTRVAALEQALIDLAGVISAAGQAFDLGKMVTPRARQQAAAERRLART